MKFRTELKKWRRANALLQKEAAALLKVNARTYEGWESGRSRPTELAISEIRRRMEEVTGAGAL